MNMKMIWLVEKEVLITFNFKENFCSSLCSTNNLNTQNYICFPDNTGRGPWLTFCIQSSLEHLTCICSSCLFQDNSRLEMSRWLHRPQLQENTWEGWKDAEGGAVCIGQTSADKIQVIKQEEANRSWTSGVHEPGHDGSTGQGELTAGTSQLQRHHRSRLSSRQRMEDRKSTNSLPHKPHLASEGTRTTRPPALQEVPTVGDAKPSEKARVFECEG